MSIRRATSSGTLPGRSLRTATPPWFANGNAPINFFQSGYLQFNPSSANVKSAWTLVTASTTDECGMMFFSAGPSNSAADRGVMIDVGVGASGQEVPIVQNVAMGNGNSSNFFQVPVPCRIPAGSRIVMRAQVGTAAAGVFPNLSLFKQAHGWQAPRSTDYSTPTPFIDTLGADTSTSRGTAMSGASGSYVEITPSTPRPYQALIVVPSAYGNAGINAQCRLTLAIGPSPETDIGAIDINQTSGGVIQYVSSNFNFPLHIFGKSIPAGTRVAIKHNISANPGYIQAVVLGIPYPTA